MVKITTDLLAEPATCVNVRVYNPMNRGWPPERNHLIKDSQHGFRRGRSCLEYPYGCILWVTGGRLSRKDVNDIRKYFFSERVIQRRNHLSQDAVDQATLPTLAYRRNRGDMIVTYKLLSGLYDEQRLHSSPVGYGYHRKISYER